TFTLSGSFSDPGTQDTHTVVISWGPGEGTTTLSLAAGVLTFSASHQYLDDNPTGTSDRTSAVYGTVSDDGAGCGGGATSVTVSNLAPAMSSLTPARAIDENGTFTLSGVLSDPGTQDTHTVVISWGPGEGTTSLSLAAGVLTFSASHQYLDDNPTGT